MPQQSAVTVENNFIKGLVTQATGLNFPENACTETYDCIFNLIGSVTRRNAFDFESNYALQTIDRSNKAISSFLWKNVNGSGNSTLLVVQIGGTLYFYDATGNSISSNMLASNINLSTYLASGAPSPDSVECQYSYGSKYLVVTHPYCDPFYVSYNSSTNVVTGSLINIQIRDIFTGDSADPYAVNTRPTTTLAGMDVHHKYNLYNQGWTTTNLTTWDTARADMPSNSDVMWRFKNSSNAFDTATVANVDTGSGASVNTPASKGHYILNLFNKNRDSASGLSGTTSENTSYQRFSSSAFFGGRVFYTGLNYLGYNSDIYFTQVLEQDSQYGMCYQQNDPTDENLFDLLQSDGGVIKIPEAGTFYKIFAISGALLCFASNGIWAITGSTGLGFKATDYTIQKISSINTISATSFVDIAGFPAWWNGDGIYTVAMEGSGPTVKSLTLTSVKSFYDAIPQSSKLYSRGYFNPITGVVQWLYRSTDASTPTDTYTFDRILNFNVITGAFYPWSIPTTSVTVNGLLLMQTTSGVYDTINIIDDSSNNVIDDSSNTVVSFNLLSTTGGKTPDFKYIVSYPSSGSYKFTIADTSSTSFKDWFVYDGAGLDYTSYFTTGFKIRGKGLMKTSPVWINIFSNTSSAVQYYMQGLWDYSLTGNTGRWSSKTYVNHTNLNYSNSMKRIKIRGHGKALQFKVKSVTGQPFHIIGWSTLEVGNQLP